MEENKKVILTGILVIVLIAAAVVIYFFVISGPKKGAEIPLKVEQIGPEIEEEPGPSLKEKPEPLDVRLEESDPLIRSRAKDLSLHPVFNKWLKTKEIIRKFVASVDNIAHGHSPRAHIDFFGLDEKLRVISENGKTLIDPRSYSRYDVVADVFSSLNTEGCVRFYWQMKPVIQEAYRELGYPEKDFHETLLQAIQELLKVPLVEEKIAVEADVTTYTYENPRLENLSDAQKHLLRMGPSNVEIIKGKLEEFALALKD